MSRTADLRRPGRGTGTSRIRARCARRRAAAGRAPGGPGERQKSTARNPDARGALARNIKQPRARLQTGSSTRTTRTNFARASRRWNLHPRSRDRGSAPCVHVCADSVRVARATPCAQVACALQPEKARSAWLSGTCERSRTIDSARQAVRPLSSGFNALSRRALLDRLTVWLVSLRRGRGLTCLWLGRLAFRLPFGLFSRHLRLERCKVGLHPCLEIEKVVVVSISC